MVVVKSNAYGHGILEISNLAIEQGINYLGVNSIDEGLLLRKNNISANIVVLGFPNHSQLKRAIENKLQLTIYDSDTLLLIEKYASQLRIGAKVHLKVETGLNRQGITREMFPSFISAFNNTRMVDLVGVSTHYANIEDTLDYTYALYQRKRFEEWVSLLKRNGITNIIRHTACSAGAIIFPDTHFDMVRIGISTYGLWSSRETRISSLTCGLEGFNLKPVLSWYSKIAQIKDVAKGSYIGYGCSDFATSDLKLAIVPVGYYEGYDRSLSNRGYLFVNGERAPIKGRICMNMTIIDVTNVGNVRIGDRVTLLNGCDKSGLSADYIASLAGTINYEIVTRINEKLPRIVI
jgi:alanine racemase